MNVSPSNEQLLSAHPSETDLPTASATTSVYNQAAKYLFSFICLILPLLYWPAAYDAAGVPREALLTVCAGIALTIACISDIRTLRVEWHPIIAMLLVLLAWATVSYAWSVDKSSSLLWITKLASLTFLAVVASRLRNADVLDYIIPVTLISASLAAVIAIGQNFGLNPLLYRMSSSTPSSTFINPNYAANFFDLIAPAALAYLLLQPATARSMKLLATIAFTLTLSCLIICRSRGSWLGLFAEVLALSIVYVCTPNFRQLFLMAVRRHARSLIIAFAIVVTIVSLPSKAPYSEKVGSILTMSADASMMERLHVYQNALVGIADHPLLGVGYGAFIMGFSPYVDAVQPIGNVTKLQTYRFMHSDPLQMFFELGIPGGLLSLAIYFLVIAMCWRIIRSNAENKLRLLGLGFLLALIASGAHACVDFPLHLPTSAFYFWLWVGLTTGLYLHIFPAKKLRLPRIVRIVVSIAGLAFTIYSSQLYAGYLRANRDVFTAMRNAIHHNCDAVFQHSDRAMNEFGRDHFTRFWYAKVYTYCDAPAKVKLAAMNRVLTLDPNMPLPYLTRAQLELDNGDLENAASDFNHFRKLLPNEADGYIGLAQITLRLHHKDQARYWLGLAVKHAPNNPQARQLANHLNLK